MLKKQIVHFLFHVEGMSTNNIGYISSLPSSIAKDNTIFEKGEYAAKLAVGPTAANPGPTLLKQAAVAEIFVSKEKGSMQSRMNMKTNASI